MYEKIKSIAFTLPTLTAGGMERFTAELANYFAKHSDFEVSIVLYGTPLEPHYQISSKIKIYTTNFSYNRKFRALEGIKRALWLRKTINKLSPDIVMSVGTSWNKFVLLSLFGTKNKVVVSDRGNPYIQQSLIYRLLERFLYPRAAGIVAQTNSAKCIYEKKSLNKNIAVIPNPIRKIDSENKNREKNIVSVGRLIDSKNFDRLLRIFNKLNRKDWTLSIIGGDSLRQNNMIQLKNLANELGIKDRVTFTGSISNIDDYLKKSSIFAFTSSSEGFPNALAEGMSAGLPLVSYDCPTGPSDMIDNNVNGFLIPMFDDDKFVDKLRFLIDNDLERLKMGEKAKEKSLEFTTEVIGAKFYEFFKNSII